MNKESRLRAIRFIQAHWSADTDISCLLNLQELIAEGRTRDEATWAFYNNLTMFLNNPELFLRVQEELPVTGW